MTDVVSILKKIGAVITDDHFVYTSGRHGEVYINKDALYPHITETSMVGELMAQPYVDKNIEVVVGPALGGIILSQWVAYHLTQKTGTEVLGVYTEKDAEENQILRRGYDKLVRGKRVLVVEDLTTTGGSVKKVVDSVRASGGEIVDVCVMVNRDPDNVSEKSIGAPFRSIGVLRADSYPEQECPFCKEGRSINTAIGHGNKFLKAKKDARE